MALPALTTIAKANRQRLLQRLMRDAKGGFPPSTAVVLPGGVTPMIYDTDMECPGESFLQESYFHWLFGVREPGYAGAVVGGTGEALLFMERIPEEHYWWQGPPPTPEQVRATYEVDAVAFCDEMAAELKAREVTRVLVLRGVNSDSRKATVLDPLAGMDADGFEVDYDLLHPVMADLRVIKTADEIEWIRAANKISSAAHRLAMKTARVGAKEGAIASAFCSRMRSKECDRLAYPAIVGSGANARTLHYHNNGKVMFGGELVLVDMGARLGQYCSDITCTYPVNGRFTDDQKIVYNGVRAALRAVEEEMRPGVRWPDMHRLAERTILDHLTGGGFLKGSLDEMMAAQLGGIFFPHGLGHLIGLDTHDVGGYLADTPARPKGPGIEALRTARVLEPGMVITCEPGCYFIPELISKAKSDPALARFLVVDRVEAAVTGVCGVRLEDNVVVTEGGVEVLTDVPRDVVDVEALMAEK